MTIEEVYNVVLALQATVSTLSKRVDNEIVTNGSLALVRGSIKQLRTEIETVDSNARSSLASKVEVNAIKATLLSLVNDLSGRTAELEDRYATIISPTRSQYYMSQETIDELNNIIRQYSVIHTEVQSTLANVVATIQSQ